MNRLELNYRVNPLYGCLVNRVMRVNFGEICFFRGKEDKITLALERNKTALHAIVLETFAKNCSHLTLNSPKLTIIKKYPEDKLVVTYENSNYKNFLDELKYYFSLFIGNKNHNYSSVLSRSGHNYITSFDDECTLLINKIYIENYKPHITLCSLHDLRTKMPELYKNLVIETENGIKIKEANVANYFNIPNEITLDEYLTNFTQYLMMNRANKLTK